MKIIINGLGRIGKLVFRRLCDKGLYKNILLVNEKEGSPEVTKNQRTKTLKRTNRKTENPKKNRKSTQKEGSPEVTQDQRTKTRKAVGPS